LILERPVVQDFLENQPSQAVQLILEFPKDLVLPTVRRAR